jgi:hypothetical protein
LEERFIYPFIQSNDQSMLFMMLLVLRTTDTDRRYPDDVFVEMPCHVMLCQMFFVNDPGWPNVLYAGKKLKLVETFRSVQIKSYSMFTSAELGDQERGISFCQEFTEAIIR